MLYAIKLEVILYFTNLHIFTKITKIHITYFRYEIEPQMYKKLLIL